MLNATIIGVREIDSLLKLIYGSAETKAPLVGMGWGQNKMFFFDKKSDPHNPKQINLYMQIIFFLKNNYLIYFKIFLFLKYTYVSFFLNILFAIQNPLIRTFSI